MRTFLFMPSPYDYAPASRSTQPSMSAQQNILVIEGLSLAYGGGARGPGEIAL